MRNIKLNQKNKIFAGLLLHPSFDINNEILMHLRALKKTKKDVSLHDPIGQDKEGNEISLIDILKSESEDVIDTIQLNMELVQSL